MEAGSLLFKNNVAVMITMASLSLVSSFSVVLTGIVFQDMRKRLFMHIIFFLSFADMCASVFALLGFPAQGSSACAAQAFGVSFFIKASILWNVMLCYQLYNLVMTGAVGLSIPRMHLLIWPLSALLSLLPLVDVTYGRSGPNDTVEWCLLHENNSTKLLIWNCFDWIFAVIGLNILRAWLAAQARSKLQNTKIAMSEASRAVGWQIYYSLLVFPIVLFVTYFPLIILNIFFFFIEKPYSKIYVNRTTQDQWLCVVTDCALLYGVSLSVIFYWKSPEARSRWYELIFGKARGELALDFDENQLLIRYSTTKGNIVSF
jgi:hypothetical protein